MPTGGLGNDEDTVAGDTFGNVRQPATLVKSADLQTALAPPDDKDFGTKIYENIGLSDFTPAPVTRVVELLGLRSYFMSQLGPRYLWIIKFSMIDDFSHKETGDAIAVVAARLPHSDVSVGSDLDASR